MFLNESFKNKDPKTTWSYLKLYSEINSKKNQDLPQSLTNVKTNKNCVLSVQKNNSSCRTLFNCYIGNLKANIMKIFESKKITKTDFWNTIVSIKTRSSGVDCINAIMFIICSPLTLFFLEHILRYK